jgi:hypothetical protein
VRGFVKRQQGRSGDSTICRQRLRRIRVVHGMLLIQKSGWVGGWVEGVLWYLWYITAAVLLRYGKVCSSVLLSSAHDGVLNVI